MARGWGVSRFWAGFASSPAGSNAPRWDGMPCAPRCMERKRRSRQNEEPLMHEEDRVTFARDVEAIQVPNGDRITINAGAEGHIIQALGGTYSVVTDNGMYRVAGKDGDAIGQPVIEGAATEVVPESKEQVEELVWDQLRTCYDP